MFVCVGVDVGQLYLRSELDFEEKRSHTVQIQAVDFDQDVDRTNQRTSVTDITIQVQVRKGHQLRLHIQTL